MNQSQLVKVVLSIPTPLFRRAESAARRLRIPRSQLYARALEVYLSQQSRPDVTDRLNAVYGAGRGEAPDPPWAAASLDVLRRGEWPDPPSSGARPQARSTRVRRRRGPSA